MTAVVVRGEPLCEDCATKLRLGSRNLGSSSELPAIGASRASQSGDEDDGTLAVLTSPAGLTKEAARIAELVEDVRYGQHSVALHATMVEQLEQALNRRAVAASRQQAIVQAKIDHVLAKHAALDADAERARALAHRVGEEDFTDDPDAWRSAMLLKSQVDAVEAALEQAEDELTVATGGEAKIKMDSAETEIAKLVAAAFSGKATRLQLSTPEDEALKSSVERQESHPRSNGWRRWNRSRSQSLEDEAKPQIGIRQASERLHDIAIHLQPHCHRWL